MSKEHRSGLEVAPRPPAGEGLAVDRLPPVSAIDFTIPDDLRELLGRVRAYVDEDALPAEAEIEDPEDVLASWHVVERLRDRARERGIYTPHLPEEWGGLGVGVLGMALVSQECGVSGLASLGLNAMAPDEGNMHTLLVAGTGDQLETYLRPLAEGRTRSCFAMTEPDVASSDPTNLRTTAVRSGDEWVLNGRKWCITGAHGAAFAIVVARTGGHGDEPAGHGDYSLILVPTDTPGWEVERDPQWMGSHAPGGHPVVTLTDVRVPASNLLGQEGEGFAIAQKRLAGGRLAHAMRWIGLAQRALDLSARRLLERKAFGKELARHQGLQFMIADSAMDLYASRLMVLHTAWKVEQGLPHRQEVAMTKTFVSEAFGRIADRAVQVHGAAGIAMDLPIARIYQDARAARIYDGASEVHRMVIARDCFKLAVQGQSLRSGTGDLG
jgi:acyl-CoA dehydrogenase